MEVTEIVPGIWRAGTRYVNWYVVDTDDGLTLVDAGLPKYREQLDGVLKLIRRQRSDIRALLLTHGHIDHVGMADVLAAEGAQVHLHPADYQLATDYRQNQTQRSIVRYMHWPGVWFFLAHCVAQGATRPRHMPDSLPLSDGGVADVPGRPSVLHVPGHTGGSVAFEFAEHGAVFVGDLLCTMNMASGRTASPRLQSRGSNHDSDKAMQSLERLDSVRSPVVLPGHGKPWTQGVEEAANSARRVGCY